MSEKQNVITMGTKEQRAIFFLHNNKYCDTMMNVGVNQQFYTLYEIGINQTNQIVFDDGCCCYYYCYGWNGKAHNQCPKTMAKSHGKKQFQFHLNVKCNVFYGSISNKVVIHSISL